MERADIIEKNRETTTEEKSLNVKFTKIWFYAANDAGECRRASGKSNCSS